jgi:nucleoside 2-deoxyribosyltransferase
MAREPKTYELFIATPSDIVNEKKIIKELCDEWNTSHGRYNNARIETRDWTQAYPIMGSRPQAIINSQIFDQTDFVVALFWTKFGSPTGVADSGTEEEIVRARNQNKPLLLYFADKMKYPSELDQAQYQRVVDFKKKHQDDGLYWTYKDEQEFEKAFRNHLHVFMNDLLAGKFEKSKTLSPSSLKGKKAEKNSGVSDTYKSVGEMKKILEKQFKVLWGEVFGIIESGDLQIGNLSFKKDNKEEIKRLKEKLATMEAEVEAYHKSCQENFNEEGIMALEDDKGAFKDEVFAKELWTVRSALTDMSNRELDRYRDSFENATATEIFDCILNIINQTREYVLNVFPKINLKTIKNIKDLKLEFLSEENMTMVGVIGLGIRSELLHRLYPNVFPIMTRRSLWGMFFLTNEDEFVIDENWNGKSRTSHQWNYEYERFCFYNNFLTNLMESYLLRHKIKIKPELRFGYINLLLVEFSKKHKEEIAELYSWKNTGL